MKEIPLSNGHVAIVDDEDYDSLQHHKWSASSTGRNGEYVYAHYRPYLGVENGVKKYGKKVKMHREIMGASPDEWIDHVNGNTLDNRRCNLRIVTPTQNSWNQRKAKTYAGGETTSTYKGVTKQIVANIRIDTKLIYLGSFKTEEDAARAYDDAARRLIGPHAALNFPNDGEQSAHR